MKKIPMRTCVVTREKFPKNELIRVVRTESGVEVDLTGRVNGHGCYLKRDVAVIESARTKKVLNRVLETEVPDSIYEELISIIK